MTETIFPAFIKAEYQPGRAWAEFKSEANRELGEVRRQARVTVGEVRKYAEDMLARPKNSNGAVDLGVGRIREAASASEARAAALRDVLAASELLASRETAMTGALQAKIAATRTALAAEEQNASALRGQVSLYEAIQSQLNATAQAQGRYAAAARNSLVVGANTTASIGAQRAGMQQLSYQIGDVSQQLALGVNPAVIFGQQIGQVTQAVQLMTNRTTGFVGFLAGPWGAVLTGAITAAALFGSKLGESASAAARSQTAADALGSAQSSLAQMFDLSTGRIVRNTEALRLNLVMQAEQLRAQAIAQRQAGLRTIRGAGEYSWTTTARNILGARIGPNGITGGDQTAAAQSGAVTQLLQMVDRAQRLPAGAGRTRELERLAVALSRVPSDRLAVSGRDLAQAGVDIRNADDIERTARDMLRSVTSGRLNPALARLQTGNRSNRGGNGAAERVAEFGEDTARRIANITGRFAETPPAIEAVRRAMGELDDIASDLERRRPPNYVELTTQLNEARTTVEQGLAGPFRDWVEEQDRQRQIQQLINQGREEEAEILSATFRIQQQQGALGDNALAQIRRRIEARAEENRLAEIARREQQAYRSTIENTRAGLEEAIQGLRTRGIGALGDFASGLQSSFNSLTSQAVVERLFGGVFRDLDDYVSGRGRLRAANDDLAGNARSTGNALGELRDAIMETAGAMRGVPTSMSGSAGGLQSPPTALADFFGQATADWSKALEQAAITVTATRRKQAPGALEDLDPRTFMARTLSGALGSIFGNSELATRLSREIGEKTATAMQGVLIGQSAAGLLFGRSGSSTGAAVGGALGNVAGEALGKTFGKVLGSLGQFAGPIGSIVGGVAGSLLGGVLTSTPRASSTIGAGNGGQLAVTATTGTRSLRGQTVTAADSVLGTIERIAELFGGGVNAALGSVSIGIRDGSYRVDPTGRGQTKLKRGAIDFGEDAEAAVRAATLDLIRDGVITGLRAGTQRLLQAAKDVDAGIEKATRFEGVFTSLKERLDPVGASIDALDKKFSSLRRVFQEAGASADELAQLEKLYGLERADAIKGAGERMTGALRSLIDDLTVNNDARSLRERLSIARAKYDPLAARVAAGDKSVDYDEFAEAARLVEQLTRQIDGSQSAYFDALRGIEDLASGALARQEALVDQAAGRGSSNKSAPVVTAIDRLGETLSGNLLGGLQPYLQQLVRQGGAGGRGSGSSSSGYSDIANF